jgi:hypothetical protein
VAVALVWAWSSQTGLIDRFTQSLRWARGLGSYLVPVKVSYQAFMKLLVRWTGKLRAAVTCGFQLLMERKFPDLFRFAGFTVLAADGSKLQAARTQSNEKRYSPKTRGKKGKQARQANRAKRRPKSKKAQAQQARDKKSDTPQIALTLLYHVTLRLPWQWQLGSSDASERQHVLNMIPQLPDDALVTADCGFFGYEFWSELLASKRHFVIRVGGNVRLLKELGYVRESQGIVYAWPDYAAKKNQPPLRMRLVVVHDGCKPWYLVTSVLDPRRLSDQQVAEIYRFRWRVELFFRHFKQTYGRAKLRSHKAEHAECEAEWSLLALWAMLLYAQMQLPGKNRGRLSVAKVLRAFAQAIGEHKLEPEVGESLNAQLSRALIDRYQRRNKTSRNYPRKKYETSAGAPKILKATAAQRKLAKKLMQQAAQKG